MALVLAPEEFELQTFSDDVDKFYEDLPTTSNLIHEKIQQTQLKKKIVESNEVIDLDIDSQLDELDEINCDIGIDLFFFKYSLIKELFMGNILNNVLNNTQHITNIDITNTTVQYIEFQVQDEYLLIQMHNYNIHEIIYANDNIQYGFVFSDKCVSVLSPSYVEKKMPIQEGFYLYDNATTYCNKIDVMGLLPSYCVLPLDDFFATSTGIYVKQRYDDYERAMNYDINETIEMLIKLCENDNLQHKNEPTDIIIYKNIPHHLYQHCEWQLIITCGIGKSKFLSTKLFQKKTQIVCNNNIKIVSKDNKKLLDMSIFHDGQFKVNTAIDQYYDLTKGCLIGWKGIVDADGKPAVAQLYIPKESLVDSGDNFKFRTNKCIVNKIFKKTVYKCTNCVQTATCLNKSSGKSYCKECSIKLNIDTVVNNFDFGEEITEGYSWIVTKDKLKYEKGKTIEIDSFAPKHKSCGRGIHFFIEQQNVNSYCFNIDHCAVPYISGKAIEDEGYNMTIPETFDMLEDTVEEKPEHVLYKRKKRDTNTVEGIDDFDDDEYSPKSTDNLLDHMN